MVNQKKSRLACDLSHVQGGFPVLDYTTAYYNFKYMIRQALQCCRVLQVEMNPALLIQPELPIQRRAESLVLGCFLQIIHTVLLYQQ